MGGLFSSSKTNVQEPKPQQSIRSTSTYRDPWIYQPYNNDFARVARPEMEPARIRNEMAELFRCQTFEFQMRRDVQTVRQRQIRKPAVERSRCNPYILNLIYDPNYNNTSIVTYKTLMKNDIGYIRVLNKITNKRNFKVDEIEEIFNPYLKKAYELKKEQIRIQFGDVEERLLFHGTKQASVDDICKYNFDWRMVKAFKFGRGVSFSPNSTYATNYSDQGKYNKVMIVAEVLVARSCCGNETTLLPDLGCDTTEKPGGVVVVKYQDNEFYPKYKIHYHLIDENVGKKPKYSRKVHAGQQLMWNYNQNVNMLYS